MSINEGIQASTNKLTPNILPCKINHEGPVNASERYWSPVPNNGNNTSPAAKTLTSHFRGRKLCGKSITVPEGYQGVVATPVKRELKALENATTDTNAGNSQDGYCEDEKEAIQLEVLATFDEVVVWGHEQAPLDSTDPYIRGVEEWIAFAAQVHSTSSS
ncbi:MAG: hypothetical protein M1829_002804 [Trizodia sp. TS-e1964]|nr:MAG: hypothetical protein M1829_002804 [Trizodia sp. TS-e1964]